MSHKFINRTVACNLRGPLQDKKGQPTRLALQANAWDEPVPKTEVAAQKLAEKGTKLLEKYQASKGNGASKNSTKSAKK